MDKQAQEILIEMLALMADGKDPLGAFRVDFNDQLNDCDDRKTGRFVCYVTFESISPKSDADVQIGENIWPLGLGVTERDALMDALPALKIFATSRGIAGLQECKVTIFDESSGDEPITDEQWQANIDAIRGGQRIILNDAPDWLVQTANDIFPTHPDEERFGACGS